MLRKRDRFCLRVDEPSKDDLLCGPPVITLLKLLYGDRLLAQVVKLVIRAEDLVDVVEGLSTDPKRVPPALRQLDKVVDVYVDVRKWWSKRARVNDRKMIAGLCLDKRVGLHLSF